MVKTFNLHITPPPDGVFHSGHNVTGKVIVETKSPKNYASIDVNLIGAATSKWYSTQKVLDKKVVLWDRNQATSSDKKLPTGRYEFPFAFTLLDESNSSAIPSTFRGEFGHITYTVDARIVKDKGFRSKDLHTNARIQVIEVVDINKQELMLAKTESVERNLAYTAFSKSPVTLSLKLPRSGFCMMNWDNIEFEVLVQNPKKRRIGHANVQLYKVVTYSDGGSNSKVFSNAISGASKTSPSIQSQPQWSWRETIPVPTTEPTTKSCKSIIIHYCINVQLTVPMSTSGNMKLEVPIVFGSVPMNPLGIDRRHSHQPAPTPHQGAFPMQRYYSQPAIAYNPPPLEAFLIPEESYTGQPLPDDCAVQPSAPTLPHQHSEAAMAAYWASPQQHYNNPQMVDQWPTAAGSEVLPESMSAAPPPPSYEEVEQQRMTHF